MVMARPNIGGPAYWLPEIGLSKLEDKAMDNKTAFEIASGLNSKTHKDAPLTSEEKRIARQKRSNANRKERDQAMRDLGLVKVRGAVSGRTYWE